MIVLTVVTTLVALAGYWHIHSAQKALLSSQKLNVEKLRAVANSSETLAADSKALFKAKSPEQAHSAYAKLAVLLEHITDQNSDIAQLQLPDTTLTGFTTLVAPLQKGLLVSRHTLIDKFNRLQHYRASRQHMLDSIEDIRSYVDLKSADQGLTFYELLDQLSLAAEGRSTTQKNRARDTIEDNFEQQLSTEKMKYQLDNLKRIVDTLDPNSQKSTIDNHTNNYMFNLRELISRSTQGKLNFDQIMTQKISVLFEKSTIKNNLFDQLRQIAAINKQVNEIHAQIAINTNKIQKEWIAIEREVIAQNNRSLAAVKTNTYIASASIIFFMLLSLGCYILIFRNVIFYKLVKPVLDITQRTTELSQGNLEQRFPEQSSTEMEAMVNALEIFRQNAKALRISEATLIEKNKALETANHDLENFAYAASHDLKSPLRGIHNLAMFLREDLGTNLAPNVEGHLNQIDGRIFRLEHLLNDLLDYAKATKNKIEPEEISTQTFLDEIFSVFNENHQYAFTVDTSVPHLNTILVPLSQVMRNIIDNAIKHGGEIGESIHIAITYSQKRYRIEIKDDGPGIDPRFHEKIFGFFQTLKPRDTVEGSGIGLALVAKIVKLYEGEIRVVSNPEQERGTTFVFDWPCYSK